MNLYTFKELVSNLENISWKLDRFRIHTVNHINKFFEDQNCAEADINLPCAEWDEEEREEFESEWAYLGNNVVASLYSEMGWDYEELSSIKTIQRSYLADCSYYNYTFYDVWKKIIQCDNVEFCYAMNVLRYLVYERTKLGNSIVNITDYALKKYELIVIRDLLSHQKRPTVFIAMSFADELREAGRYICDSIKAAGYEPILMHQKEHNEWIVPEIIYEIKRSLFVVADFTGQKNGVYYEAGFSKALDKVVIMTCRKDSFNDVNFDTSQINHIVWENENDLYEKLLTRIVKTIGRNEVI
ncbi:hypothetical protein AB432_030135 [Brevibacillus brevis]|uniref:Nucleoside 2-deoxyribosyltransferase n=1 Tax=Brevibacillus brevis TaxID=1393 RepID=A0A2Z4MR57_BREBE|nr:hypothetical protein [Brevibacillus brevis]AWX59047.1 hypothetical protein AB432_030135 [Brevibacillus brevis]